MSAFSGLRLSQIVITLEGSECSLSLLSSTGRVPFKASITYLKQNSELLFEKGGYLTAQNKIFQTRHTSQIELNAWAAT